jgi:hypothetical protein
LSVVDRSFDHALKREEHAAMPLAGGIMGNGYQCGMLWGAALAAGARAYQLFGPGPQAEAEALVAGQRLVAAFRARNKHINCLEITEMSMKSSSRRRFLVQLSRYFLKGGPILCFSMTAGYAPVALDEINTAYSEKHSAAPASPVSCAAMLAHKLGASDMHAVMAAGLAGGIGLSGGACGALGAALWIMGMNNSQEGVENTKSLSFPGAEEAVERFLQSADFEFECSKIVGRKFENADDHASYVRAGGCSKIIETLAVQP